MLHRIICYTYIDFTAVNQWKIVLYLNSNENKQNSSEEIAWGYFLIFNYTLKYSLSIKIHVVKIIETYSLIKCAEVER